MKKFIGLSGVALHSRGWQRVPESDTKGFIGGGQVAYDWQVNPNRVVSAT